MSLLMPAPLGLSSNMAQVGRCDVPAMTERTEAEDGVGVPRSVGHFQFPCLVGVPSLLVTEQPCHPGSEGRTHARLSDLDKHSRPGRITSVLGGVARPKRPPDSAGCDPLRSSQGFERGDRTHTHIALAPKSARPPSLLAFNLLFLKWFLK